MVVAGTVVPLVAEEPAPVVTTVVVMTVVLAGQLVTVGPQEVIVIAEVIVVVKVTTLPVGVAVGAMVAQLGIAVTRAGLLVM